MCTEKQHPDVVYTRQVFTGPSAVRGSCAPLHTYKASAKTEHVTVTAHGSSQSRARDKTDQLSNIKIKSVFLLMGLCHTGQTTRQ